MTTTRLSPGADLAAAVRGGVDGDTLLLEPGRYSVDKRLLIKRSITLAGYAGPAQTILEAKDGGELVKVFGSGSTVVIRGLTLRAGVSDGGGAVMVQNDAQALIDDCIFEGNQAVQFGGGAVMGGGQAKLEVVRSIFAGNQAARGGAVALVDKAEGTIDRCTFTGNEAEIGGAVYVEDGAHVVVKSSTFQHNVAKHSHGGADVFVKGTKSHGPVLDIVNCVLAGSKPMVNHPEYPGTLNLAHSIVAPGSLAECGVTKGEAVLEVQPELEEVSRGLFGLRREVAGTGTADLGHIDADALDVLGQPLVREGRADPGAIAARG
jgi:hypothetical protein